MDTALTALIVSAVALGLSALAVLLAARRKERQSVPPPEPETPVRKSHRTMWDKPGG